MAQPHPRPANQSAGVDSGLRFPMADGSVRFRPRPSHRPNAERPLVFPRALSLKFLHFWEDEALRPEDDHYFLVAQALACVLLRRKPPAKAHATKLKFLFVLA